MSEKMLKMIEKRTCQSFDKQNLEELKAKVENYISEYGAYKTLANNCTHFAIRIYNFASGDNFPLVQTPRRVGQIITKMEDAI